VPDAAGDRAAFSFFDPGSGELRETTVADAARSSAQAARAERDRFAPEARRGTRT
jgi:hypothetical protein